MSYSRFFCDSLLQSTLFCHSPLHFGLLLSHPFFFRLREAFNELPKSFLAPFYLGEVFLDQRQYSQAKRLLHKANTRSNWTYRHVLYALGRLHMEVKDYRAAVDVFEKIVKLDAHYKDVRTLLKKAKKQTAN